ncbi:hypothetical protein [Methylobacterium iners]|uniref:Uncharacterized protein n=1 Tax=Methylobacterium iners TaxID=418707 RepID=A0ABQ4S722_9HYPH|nr:hypothetical protein [Methylobacterium iners]GJD97485.1 hypothetical protein OCOJLMKI_4716 [Methylobacterium iners]
MADTLIDLIRTVANSGARQATTAPQGIPTDAENPGPNLSGGFGDPLNSLGTGDGTQRPIWFPEPPDLSGSISPDNPEAPGGALEILSVKQIRGAPSLTAPASVIRYQVRGQVV